MNTIRKYTKGNGGFTLVEIAIVVAIIGLLLLIALPLFTGARVRAYVAESRSMSSEWKALAWSCLIEKNFKESKCDSLAETGWATPPVDSDVWNWSTSVIICGNTAVITYASTATACAGATDVTGNNAYVGLAVTPKPGFIPSDQRYVLIVRTNTGRVQESPADGTDVPTP